jgi:Domain of unknown function (DUF4440)
MNLQEDEAATLNHIRKVERARFAAMISGDTDAVSRFLDDELIYIHSSGLADRKAAYLRSFRNGKFSYDKVQA